MYAKCGQLEHAKSVWSDITKYGISANAHVYCTMFSVCAQLKDSLLGEQIYHHMVHHQIPLDTASFNALLNMYVRCGNPFHAISLWSQNEKSDGIQPDITTYSNILTACGETGNLSLGKEVHAIIKSRRLPLDAIVDSCLIKMYSDCGRFVTWYHHVVILFLILNLLNSIKAATDAFEISRKSGRMNTIVWTAFMLALAQHGQAQQALTLFDSISLEGW